MHCFSCVAGKECDGFVRLDKYITEVQSEASRSCLKNGDTQILVNGQKAKFSYKVKQGDRIDVSWEDRIPDNIEPEQIALDILYEDNNVTVVNKAQGMVTHPAAGNWSGTLVNALLYHWKAGAIHITQGGDAATALSMQRPGIVHRLDKDTSGVIITAKNRIAEEWLHNQFTEREVQKEYIAIVAGRPPSADGDLCTGFVRDSRCRQKWMAVPDVDKGKFARTLYHCIACYGPYSLMRLCLKTGRTHQIRAHMKYIGCPVVGDPLYGLKADLLFRDATLMLHSRMLCIKLPGQTECTAFIAPIPQRFKTMMSILHSKYHKDMIP